MPQRRDADAYATAGQHFAQLRQRRIRLLLDRVQDEGRMRFDPRCATVAALRLGRWRAVSERQLSPPDRARCTDPETFGRLSARQSAFNRSNNTVPKIT